MIVNRNQENLGLYNGDLGIVLEDDEGFGVFPGAGWGAESACGEDK